MSSGQGWPGTPRSGRPRPGCTSGCSRTSRISRRARCGGTTPRGGGDPAYWNLGIAATVQRDWATARDAWQGFGTRLPDAEGRIDHGFGHACVRRATGGEREVVWIERRCGEIVVHDGVPNGERVVYTLTREVEGLTHQAATARVEGIAETVRLLLAGPGTPPHEAKALAGRRLTSSAR